MKRYTLIGADGVPYQSPRPGTVGGHRKTRIYGRLDCSSARRAIANGGYAKHRVFFADEATALAAGYRPCARCLPQRYRRWKTTASRTTGSARTCSHWAPSRFSDATATSTLGNSWSCASSWAHGGGEP
jgi:methylphosphotriester-DNA--protein-cysteine methyltransferase